MSNDKPTYEELLRENEILKKQLDEKKNLEKELEKSQILMHAAFDQSPVAMAIVSYPDFTFKIINKASEELLLINAENYLNKSPNQIEINWKDLNPDGTPIPFESLPMPAALHGKETKNLDILLERHDGTKRWELTSAAPIFDKEGNIIACILVMIDNTERKNTEQIITEQRRIFKEKNEEYEAINEELRKVNENLKKAKEKAEENEKKYNLFFNSVADAIFIHDSYGRIIDVNNAACFEYGYSYNELISLNIAQIDAPSEIKNIPKRISELMNVGFVAFETIHLRKDKSEIPVDVNSKKIKFNGQSAILSICRNITERNKAEQIIREQLDIIRTKNQEYEQVNEELLQINNELHIAIKKVEDSEMKFRKAIEFLTLPIAIANKKGEVLFYNNQFVDTYGYTISEISSIQEWFLKAYPNTEYRNFVLNDWDQVSEYAINNNLSTPVREYNVTCKNGDVKTVEISMFPDKDIFIGLFQDVSNRKKTENELLFAKEKAEESERRLLYAQQLAELGFWDWNVETGSLYWSDYTYIHYGFKPQEFIPDFDIFSKIVHPEDLPFVLENVNNALNSNEDYSIKFRFVRPSGEIRFLYTKGEVTRNKQGRAIRFVGSQIDITSMVLSELELIAAKEKAEESEIKYKTAFKTNPDAININKLDGTYVDVNYGFTQLTGYTFDEVFGVSSLNLNIWKNPKDRETLISGLKENGSVSNLEAVFCCKDGSTKTALMSASLIRLKEETYILSITRDISERKNLENELITAKEKAEESDRLKTAFLQNMSHEIRTPLNAISGFAGMLNKPELSEEKKASFISIIQNSSNQLISIVSDILTISSLETKQEEAHFEKVCINSIIVDFLTIFKLQAQNKNISLYAKKTLNNIQSEIYTDKTKFSQILSNLISNALKFTHEGFIEFGYNLKNELETTVMEFYVKDSGIGIKSEFHQKIFERFRQADKSINKLYGGTGLGLSISKGFVELLGGKIWVQSEHEKGATFYFTIPYKPVYNEITDNTKVLQISNKPIVLIAEDEEYNFLFLEELLIDLNFELIHAKDGKEAVDIFNLYKNIDLILMDIKMPIMTGYEAAQIIKSINPEIPIVAQSAYALEHERAKYEGIFDAYLTKPIQEDDLKQVVLRFISQNKY